ncbi:cytochrome c biogenesis CcdA family protein [Kribbella sp.]|uniref:cytochrome c biogenesis CcdA family protein n=1 Tax=Kribbella sp. TaxID=1871183 RepID=UPI002D2D38C1|nr:cytochrome c biogenesis CcdA family protein [Kribbella sp.]HZX08795.1 cytochrome c biogenesis CcdA family protein [Kribbella sp.]
MELHAGVQVGLAAALLAGLLSLLSPCSVMLLPAFFSYTFEDPRRLIGRTVVFYAGLLTTLVPLGVLAGSLGSFLTEHRGTLGSIAAYVLIALGCYQALGLRLPGRTSAPARGTSAVSVYLLGTVYGLTGACSGPLLGSVLTYAAFGASPAYGGLVMAVFALGMAVPLFVLALVWKRFPRTRVAVRPRMVEVGPVRTTWTQIVSGVVTAAIGVLVLVTDGFAAIGGLNSVDSQFALEEQAGRLAAQVPDTALIGVVLLVVAGVGAVGVRRSRRTATKLPQGIVTRTDEPE